MDLVKLLSCVKDKHLRAKLVTCVTKRGTKLTADRIKHDPYVLLDHAGWTFVMVDRLAEAFAISRQERAKRIVLQAVKSYLHDRGDSLMNSTDLKTSIRCVGWDRRNGKSSISITSSERMDAYFDMLEEGETLLLVSNGSVVWSQCLLQERAIMRLATASASLPDLSQTLAADALDQSYERMQLSAEQRRAVLQAFSGHRLSLITGNPGCGKSACCDAIAHVAQQLQWRCHFVAFTWLAAQRISQVCQGVKATSIHKYVYTLKSRAADFVFEKQDDLLWFDKDDANDDNTTRLVDKWANLDLLVVDEASMASTSIVHMLLNVLPAQCRLLLVGDDAQLPPIGWGQPFVDLVAAHRAGCKLSLTCPMTELTHVFRTDKAHIMEFAAACRSGSMPAWSKSSSSFDDFEWHSESDPDMLLSKLTSILANRGTRDFQMLVAGKQGRVGMWALNALAARVLSRRCDETDCAFLLDQSVICLDQNGPVPEGTLGKVLACRKGMLRVQWRTGVVNEVPADATYMAHAFVVGDKVMYTDRSHPEVRNGERGFVVEVDKKNIRVQYDSGISLWHPPSEQQYLQLAYAITVHKYQGNETSHAILIVHPSHGTPLLTRNLLYTGSTRGKDKLTLMCDTQTLGKCLSMLDRRKTCLGMLLAGDSLDSNILC